VLNTFSSERALVGKEVLPQIEAVSPRSYWSSKPEPLATDLMPKLGGLQHIKDIIAADKPSIEVRSKTSKDKLPDLKVPKVLVNKLPSLPTVPAEGSLKTYDHTSKLQDNTKMNGRVKANIVTQPSLETDPAITKYKNSQQVLQKIVKPKKMTAITRCKTLALDGFGEKGVTQVPTDELRVRVNSLKGSENNLRPEIFPKTDSSLDQGNLPKSKFIHQNFDQKKADYSYFQGVVSKIINETKEAIGNGNSQSHYSKENQSILSNSVRAKDGAQIRKLKNNAKLIPKDHTISGLQQSTFANQAPKAKAEETSHMYKDIRQSIKLREQPKLPQSAQTGITQLRPLNGVNRDNKL